MPSTVATKTTHTHKPSENGSQSADIPVKRLEKVDGKVRKTKVNSQVQSYVGRLGIGSLRGLIRVSV
ncbi:growth arrest-specific protein 7a isoform X1 [Tachysurus ichikawai]